MITKTFPKLTTEGMHLNPQISQELETLSKINTKNHTWKNQSKTAQSQKRKRKRKRNLQSSGEGTYCHPRSNSKSGKLLLIEIVEALVQWSGIFRLLENKN